MIAPSALNRTLFTAVLLLAGCGYFNSMYNARRRFSDAERAAASGEEATARTAYADAIERAAVSYRGHPDSRWADDALFLIGRARFELGEYRQARAALLSLLDLTDDAGVRSGAFAYLGASHLQLGDPTKALPPLDSAAAYLDPGERLAARTRLWRARARFATGKTAAGWEDLDLAAKAGANIGLAARLESVWRALAAGDSARSRASLDALLRDDRAATSADSIGDLISAAAGLWGSAWARARLAGLNDGDWPGPARNRLRLLDARLAAAAGDTAGAIATAVEVARGATQGEAVQARILAARWSLATLSDAGALDAVRTLLSPVSNDPAAQEILEPLEAVDQLVQHAGNGDHPLALFAAAEAARDKLRAPRLACRLFTAYADQAPDDVWAPKALLAAANLAADPELADSLRRRFLASGASIYVQALDGGAPPGSFARAEESLATGLAEVRASIAPELRRRVSSGHAAAALDSLAERVRADSLRLACGGLLDSLGVTGIRADSARAACMRTDSARLADVLQIDTVLLRDTARARLEKERARREVIDTFRLRRP